MAAGSTGGELMPLEMDDAVVLGAMPAELVAEYMDDALFPGVMVMLEARTEPPGADTEFDLRVMASLPSFVAVPSLRS